jgi:glutamate-1-semialdehyde 2,1-aminomutase
MDNTPNDKAYPHSEELFRRSTAHIPGGVNSPVRACRAVGGTPAFAARARGSRLWDVDGNEYVDYVLSYGPAIVGHSHPTVAARIAELATEGLCYGAPTEAEAQIAEQLCRALPSMELVRLVNSGTEATMAAIRVARGFTGRPIVVKFKGCYHGHADYLLVRSGSGAATLGVPDSLGVSPETARNTLTSQFNDVGELERLFQAKPNDIACVILEPVCGNMGVVAPAPGFLEAVRALCTQHGALLIFDEVMTGFRVAWGGAQLLYGVTPDITCLGKVIGGGLPVGAYGGRRDVMSMVSPLGGVYQAGTLSGNPLSVGAGLATLALLQDGAAYHALEDYTARLAAGLEDIVREVGIPATVQRVGSMFTLFFGAGPFRNIDEIDACDKATFAKFFHGMRNRGVNLPPSQYEACFTSTAHGEECLARTLEAARATLRAL